MAVVAGAARRLEQEPGPLLGLVEPVLDQARGRGILVLVSNLMGVAERLGHLLESFISSRSMSAGGTNSASLSSMTVCSLAIWPIERSVVLPILRTRSAMTSVAPRMSAACSSKNRC